MLNFGIAFFFQLTFSETGFIFVELLFLGGPGPVGRVQPVRTSPISPMHKMHWCDESVSILSQVLEKKLRETKPFFLLSRSREMTVKMAVSSPQYRLRIEDLFRTARGVVQTQ